MSDLDDPQAFQNFIEHGVPTGGPLTVTYTDTGYELRILVDGLHEWERLVPKDDFDALMEAIEDMMAFVKEVQKDKR